MYSQSPMDWADDPLLEKMLCYIIIYLCSLYATITSNFNVYRDHQDLQERMVKMDHKDHQDCKDHL